MPLAHGFETNVARIVITSCSEGGSSGITVLRPLLLSEIQKWQRRNVSDINDSTEDRLLFFLGIKKRK